MAPDDEYSLRDIIDCVGYLGDRDVIDRLVPDRLIRADDDRLRRQIAAPHPWRYTPGLPSSMRESCADCGLDPRNTIHRVTGATGRAPSCTEFGEHLFTAPDERCHCGEKTAEI